MAGGRRVLEGRLEAEAAEALQQLGVVQLLLHGRVVEQVERLLVGRVDGGGLGEVVPDRVT